MSRYTGTRYNELSVQVQKTVPRVALVSLAICTGLLKMLPVQGTCSKQSTPFRWASCSARNISNHKIMANKNVQVTDESIVLHRGRQVFWATNSSLLFPLLHLRFPVLAAVSTNVIKFFFFF